jgi:hypothetical protein
MTKRRRIFCFVDRGFAVFGIVDSSCMRYSVYWYLTATSIKAPATALMGALDITNLSLYNLFHGQ